MKSEVTVVIPFYNPGEYLYDALDSVLEQTFDGWTILLINDGSTDNTLMLIKDYLKHPKIRLINHPNNLNLSHSLNTALQAVDTPYMLHLDADDYLYPYTLEVIYNAAKQQSDDVALICGNINLVFENKLGEIVKEKPKYGNSFKDRYEFLKGNSSLWPRFYRTKALRDIGGWPTDDPYKGEYAEDLNILYRLVEKYRVVWINKLLLNHRRHFSNQTLEMKKLAEAVEWIVRSTLKRWGDEYEPIFRTDREGWKKVVALIPKKDIEAAE